MFGEVLVLQEVLKPIMAGSLNLFFISFTMPKLSEPRFGPGMIWPSWSGSDWVGCRSCVSNTVAVLISKDLSDRFTQLPNVGNERAIWLCVSGAEPGKEGEVPSLLILAVYALPAN